MSLLSLVDTEKSELRRAPAPAATASSEQAGKLISEAIGDRRLAGPEIPTCRHPAGRLVKLFPARDYITGHQFEIAHCSACELAVTTPEPPPASMDSYYPATYYGSLRDRRFPGVVEFLQQALYRWRVRRVESVSGLKQGRVLDVGCGRGQLLEQFRRCGWKVQGTELSESSARYPREALGLPVEVGNLEAIGFPTNHFDAIVLWHVLEHISDPQTLLAEVNRLLKPGGVLLVSVPNFGGYEARFFRDKWFHLDVPRHVAHLTRPMLGEALSNSGFAARHWSGLTPEYDTFSFVQSALNKCGLRHNLLYDLLRGKQAKLISGQKVPGWQTAASFLLGGVFACFGIAATFLAGLVGQGGTMTVFAVKEQEVPSRSRTLSEWVWKIVRPRRHPQRVP